MIRTIFSIVALSLNKIAKLLHLTYNEINIIGKDDEGTFYAIQTLRQLMVKREENIVVNE